MIKRKRAFGVTLVELVISIAVISAGITGILLVINQVVRTSADPMVQEQAVAIAEAYMAEILTKDYNVGPGATRSTFDDVDDYNGLNQVPTDQTNTPIGGLGSYNVTVATTAEVLSGQNAKRVQITVTGPASVTVVLSGYRTDYP